MLTKVELLEDRVRAHYHLNKSYGVPDVEDSLEVTYETLHQLLPLPADIKSLGIHGARYFVEDIYIPSHSAIITLVFSQYPERDWGPLEENLYGPFLRNKGGGNYG